MKNKVYNVIIGQQTTIPGTPAVPGTPAQGENPPVDAVPATPDRVEYNPNVGNIKVVAADVEEVVAKVKPQLDPGQHLETVEKISEIDVA